jgi:hypothetical protein
LSAAEARSFSGQLDPTTAISYTNNLAILLLLCNVLSILFSLDKFKDWWFNPNATNHFSFWEALLIIDQVNKNDIR